MKPEQLRDLLQYRMEQAYETLLEAEILMDASALRGTMNRAYYAMFYAVLALLATKQLGTSKHSGAISLFDREYVKTGIFPREFSKALHLAFDQRQIHDYGEMIELDALIVEQAVANARVFVDQVQAYLAMNFAITKAHLTGDDPESDK
ncbi:MAG: HEPN domain-containing protein [Caldilineaceae bacterium]|nr:HEPN domain-containing protein [Caldilineaceae bacterium]